MQVIPQRELRAVKRRSGRGLRTAPKTAVALALACVATATGCGWSAAPRRPTARTMERAAVATQGTSGSRLVALEEGARRFGSPVLVPRDVPEGFVLRGAEVIWVPHDRSRPDVPGRRALRLLYEHGQSGKAFSVVQERHPANSREQDDLYCIISQGGFFANMSVGTRLCFGQESGVDYAIVSRDLSETETSRLAASMSKLEPVEAVEPR